MIGRLVGTLAEKSPPLVLLDVGGVGYEVDVPMSTFYNLPDAGAKVTLFTHLVVREDAHLLYGFGTEHERREADKKSCEFAFIHGGIPRLSQGE